MYRLVKGLEYQRVVIAVPNHIGHNAPVIEIQDGTQVDLMNLDALIPLELGHVGEPLLVGFVRIEQDVLRYVLRILGGPGTTVVAVLDGRLDAPDTADAEYSLVVHMDAMVMLQLVPDPPIALVRTLCVDGLYLLCQLRVFRCPSA